jgi:hypothetical protein
MGATPFDRTTRRIAGAGSLVAGALAVYWLIDVLHKQVPDSAATNVELNILFWSIVALCFGLVAMRREPSDRSTNAAFIFALQSACWASSLVFKLNQVRKPEFGPAGIVSFAIAVGLVVSAILIQVRRDRGAA